MLQGPSLIRDTRSCSFLPGFWKGPVSKDKSFSIPQPGLYLGVTTVELLKAPKVVEWAVKPAFTDSLHPHGGCDDSLHFTDKEAHCVPKFRAGKKGMRKDSFPHCFHSSSAVTSSKTREWFWSNNVRISPQVGRWCGWPGAWISLWNPSLTLQFLYPKDLAIDRCSANIDCHILFLVFSFSLCNRNIIYSFSWCSINQFPFP